MVTAMRKTTTIGVNLTEEIVIVSRFLSFVLVNLVECMSDIILDLIAICHNTFFHLKVCKKAGGRTDWIGDDFCDDDDEYINMNDECQWDGGDCYEKNSFHCKSFLLLCQLILLCT